MEDLTGLGKLADSKLVNKAYDDASGSSAMKELGKLTAELTKTLRLFTAPFQLAALAQDRFERWLGEVRNRVPVDRQIEADPHISGPALKAMLFMDDDNPLSKLFINLLAQAIDKENAESVHPGFVHIIEQMSPDEALLLYKIKGLMLAGVNRTHIINEKGQKVESNTNISKKGFAHPNKIAMYFKHLEGLCLLINQTHDKIVVNVPEDRPEWKNFTWYALSEFGVQFLNVCRAHA